MDGGDLGILAIWTICLGASLAVSALSGGRLPWRARAAAPLETPAEPVAPPAPAAADPLVLPGFRRGEDVVSLPVAPERAGLVTVGPSADGADGIVAIGDEILAVVPGVPELTAEDLRLIDG